MNIFSGIMINTFIKWMTMTYLLCGTIVCVSLYLLKKFTTVDVIEQENMFRKSPNIILKTVPITLVSVVKMDSVLPSNVDIDCEKKQEDGSGFNGASDTNAIPLSSEIVTEAAKVTEIDDNLENR